MSCPKCQSAHWDKAGFVQDIQRFLCRTSGCQYTRGVPKGMLMAVKLLAVTLYFHGLSLNAIDKLLQISAHSVLKWIRTFAEIHCAKPQPTVTAAVIKLDEMWHFLKKSLATSGSGKHIVAIQGGSWTGKCGGRDYATCHRLITRLQRWSDPCFYTDHWEVYLKTVGSTMPLVQSKAETHGVERSNTIQRH